MNSPRSPTLSTAHPSSDPETSVPVHRTRTHTQARVFSTNSHTFHVFAIYTVGNLLLFRIIQIIYPIIPKGSRMQLLSRGQGWQKGPVGAQKTAGLALLRSRLNHRQYFFSKVIGYFCVLHSSCLSPNSLFLRFISSALLQRNADSLLYTSWLS